MIVKRVKKIYKQLFMVFIMVFSVFGICNLNVNSVSANSGNIPIKRIREIKYPSALGDYSTWVTEINGNIGYCLEASKNTPVNGNYVYNEITNNENLLKTLYYGCGGPADIISWSMFIQAGGIGLHRLFQVCLRLQPNLILVKTV